MIKVLLGAVMPLQHYVDKASPTHALINRQALAILTADGKVQAALLLSQFLDSFNEGCDWADTGWRNIGHMFNPATGQGLRGCPSAVDLLRDYWDLANRYRAEWHLSQAFFYLGAAAHLLQDLCVPHHAAVKVLAGHGEFEAYARRYRHQSAVHSGGLYDLARTPEGWVTKNADYTLEHYGSLVGRVCSRERTHAAVADLLARAQRSTAGFVVFFVNGSEVV